MKTAARIAFVAFLLSLDCGTAAASEWLAIGNSDDEKTEIVVDVSSIRVKGEIRRAWIKLAYSPNTRKGVGPHANKWVKHFLTLVAFNCAEELESTEALNVYFTDGTNASVDSSLPSLWKPVPPDTLVSVEMHFVCAWKVE